MYVMYWWSSGKTSCVPFGVRNCSAIDEILPIGSSSEHTRALELCKGGFHSQETACYQKCSDASSYVSRHREVLTLHSIKRNEPRSAACLEQSGYALQFRQHMFVFLYMQ